MLALALARVEHVPHHVAPRVPRRPAQRRRGETVLTLAGVGRESEKRLDVRRDRVRTLEICAREEDEENEKFVESVRKILGGKKPRKKKKR